MFILYKYSYNTSYIAQFTNLKKKTATGKKSVTKKTEQAEATHPMHQGSN